MEIHKRITNGYQNDHKSSSICDNNNNVKTKFDVNNNENLVEEFSKGNIDEALQPLELVKERPSYGTLLWNTNYSFRTPIMRVRDIITVLTLISLLDCFLYPDKFNEFINFWSTELWGLFGYAGLIVAYYHVAFIAIWGILNITDSNLLITLLSTPVLLPMITVPLYLRLTQPIGFGMAIAMTFHQMIVFMKIWSLIVTSKSLSISERFTFRQAVYFLLAPTFVLRKEYPRWKEANFIEGLTYFARFIFYVLHVGFTLNLYGYPNAVTFLKALITENRFDLNSAFAGIVVVSYVVFILWYLIWHLWLNTWSSFLGYGDRLHYEDWWAADSTALFLRKWNRPVYGFLREFINRPLRKRFSAAAARGLTMFVSMIFHDYLSIMLNQKIPPFWITLGTIYMVAALFGIHLMGSKIHPFLASCFYLFLNFYMCIQYLETKLRQICTPMNVPKWLDVFMLYTLSCRGEDADISRL